MESKVAGAEATTSGVAGWLWGPWSPTGAAIAAAVFVVDQAHKYWMIEVFRIAERGRVTVAPFLDLVYAINTGISYGLMSQDGHGGQWALASFAALASALLMVWLARGATNAWMAAGIGQIVGGALANALDRLHLGGVADFFSLHAYGFYWYIFNIADVAIVAGVACLLYDSLYGSRDAQKPH